MLAPSSQEQNAYPIYRPDIDGLRAIAILSVVIFHAFPSLLPGGFVGVDVFFVISGYLISNIIFRSLQRGNFSFAEFYAHRVNRIFPALIVVLVVSYVFGWFALLPDEFKQLGKHIAASAGFFQNLTLKEEAGYFDAATELKPMMHLWSLAIEEQFYLVYPLLIWGVWRLGFNLLVVLTILSVLSFGLNITGVEKDVIRTFFAPQTRFWELLAGAILAYMQFFKQARTIITLPLALIRFFQIIPRGAVLNNLFAIVGFLLILVAVVELDRTNLFPGWWVLLPVMGAVLLIDAGADAWVNRRILSNRVMVFIGIISYPLYLWHWSLLSFAWIIEEGLPSRTIRAAALVLSFLLAWFTYLFIERPIRFGHKTSFKTSALCIVMIATGFVGHYTFTHDGFPSRISRSVLSNNEPFSRDIIRNAQFCRQENPSFKDDWCLKSKDFAPTILMLGDSHSRVLYSGMNEWLSSATDSILVLARGGCTPFFGVASFQKGNQDQCVEDANYAANYAEKHDSIRTVILFSRGPMYISGRGFGIVESTIDRTISLSNRPEITDFRRIYKAAMIETLVQLQASSKQIVFVLDVPELGFNPKLCVETRPLYLGNFSIKQPCAVSRKDFDARNREYRKLVFSVLKNFPSVHVFDAASQLCDAEWCWAMKDGKMLYRDDDHLSFEGSRLVAHELVKLLQTESPLRRSPNSTK